MIVYNSHIGQAIRQIAATMNLRKRTGQKQVCYKRKKNEDGRYIYIPSLKKHIPNYSIAVWQGGKWNVIVKRNNETDQFEDLVTQILQQVAKDFVKVSLYQNQSRNFRNAGEENYLLVLNPNIPHPPAHSHNPKKPPPPRKNSSGLDESDRNRKLLVELRSARTEIQELQIMNDRLILENKSLLETLARLKQVMNGG